jgi:hypothetical protein
MNGILNVPFVMGTVIPRKHIITNGKNDLCYNVFVYVMCCVNSN